MDDDYGNQMFAELNPNNFIDENTKNKFRKTNFILSIILLTILIIIIITLIFYFIFKI